jgi:exonuclease SbcC
MIPILLEIQGLYSYREKQVIDFEKLTAAGIFGIFGAVGSGKSSILEAVLLALYGSTERLSDRGEKSSMLNLQSDALLINFEFRSGKNNQSLYLARYSAKRNKKDPEKVDPAEHIFYLRQAGEWEPLEARAEDIIGMKKEHFKQTVIIPQGKFREFIDLTPGPRAEMMKELFGLERFDLSQKTGALLKVEKENRIRLETQLAGLEEYSKSNLKESESQLDEIRLKISQSSKNLDQQELGLRSQETQGQKHSELLKFAGEKQGLESKKPEIERNRILHREFITAKTYLKPTWDNLKDCNSELEKAIISATDCVRFKERFEQEVAQLEQEETDLKEKNKDRPNREAKVRDLKKVAEIQGLAQDLSEASKKVETLRPEIESKEVNQKSIEKQIKELEQQSENLTNVDASQLSELKSAARESEQIERQKAYLEENLGQIKAEELEAQRVLESLLATLPSQEKSAQDWLEVEKKVLKSLENDREKLMVKQGLTAHVHLLHAGEPCPLCGSMEHPSPLQATSDEEELQSLRHRIESTKTNLEQLLSLIQKQQEIEIRRESQQKSKSEKTQELAQILSSQSDLNVKLEAFGIADQSSLLKRIETLDQASQIKSKLEQTLKGLRQSWSTDRLDLEAIEKTFNQASLLLHAKQTAISIKNEEIKDPTFCRPFFQKELNVIKATIENVENDIQKAIELLDGKQKHLREKRAEQSTNLADLKNFELRKVALSGKLEELTAAFSKLKIDYNFQDEQALILLFEHSIDAEKVDLLIRQFDQKLATVSSRILELQSEPGVADFDQDKFLAVKAEFQLLKSQHESMQQDAALLQQRIKESQSKLSEKATLEKTLATLDIRETNLKELDRLFKGSGFVKYVSTIYLQELCNTANSRFMKLSKNSLSLEIDSDNTFWVIDYLNGGKRRLLKTLSGGQTFQASLCLALALAEKVKSLNQADQSFFFLDEGFGALDRNALRVVFETLKSLRHENRIVGIISHVEELQQEIGVYAQIELDPEKGSQVSYSY